MSNAQFATKDRHTVETAKTSRNIAFDPTASIDSLFV
jgi:hypothetical protein